MSSATHPRPAPDTSGVDACRRNQLDGTGAAGRRRNPGRGAPALWPTCPGSVVLVACSGRRGFARAGGRARLRRAPARLAGRGRRGRPRVDGRLRAAQRLGVRDVPGPGAVTGGGSPARAPRREGPARDARRQALMQAAARLGAAAVLLGHTRDDQAETVLMRLARGAGARSLAGMAARSGLFRRPLLGLSRIAHPEACRVSGLSAWDGPSQRRPRFRPGAGAPDALPALVAALGPGVPLGTCPQRGPAPARQPGPGRAG